MSDFSLSVGHIFSSCSLLFVWMEVWRLGLVHFGVGFGYKLKICLTAGGVEIVILIFARSDWACVNTWSRSIFPLSRFIIWRISLKLFIITCDCYRIEESFVRIELFWKQRFQMNLRIAMLGSHYLITVNIKDRSSKEKVEVTAWCC